MVDVSQEKKCPQNLMASDPPKNETDKKFFFWTSEYEFLDLFIISTSSWRYQIWKIMIAILSIWSSMHYAY